MIVISSIEVRFVSHATEDERRLKVAAEGLFGVLFTVEVLEGHWGNPIHVFTARLEGPQAEQLLRRLAASVPVRDFDVRCEGSRFYLRVSKSALLRGELVPGEDVQLKVKFPRKVDAGYLRRFWKV